MNNNLVNIDENNSKNIYNNNNSINTAYKIIRIFILNILSKYIHFRYLIFILLAINFLFIFT